MSDSDLHHVGLGGPEVVVGEVLGVFINNLNSDLNYVESKPIPMQMLQSLSY